MKRIILFFALSILIGFKVFGQVKVITGQIVDPQNRPISAVSISIVGNNNSAVSDDVGIFQINFSPELKNGQVITLKVEKKGYRTLLKHTAASYLSIPIKLVRSANKQSNVVVLHQQSSSQVPTINNNAKNLNIGNNYGVVGDITVSSKPTNPVTNELLTEVQTKLVNKSKKVTILYNSIDPDAGDFCRAFKDSLVSIGYKNVVAGAFMDLVNVYRPGIAFIDSETEYKFIISTKPLN